MTSVSPEAEFNIRTTKVLLEILEERKRQHQTHGEQNWPSGTGAPYFSTLRQHYQTDCDYAFEHGLGTWVHILQEELYEVLAESDPKRIRAELIQLAAVAVQWAECIDRNQSERH